MVQGSKRDAHGPPGLPEANRLDGTLDETAPVAITNNITRYYDKD